MAKHDLELRQDAGEAANICLGSDRKTIDKVLYQLFCEEGSQGGSLCAHAIQNANAWELGMEANEWSSFESCWSNRRFM